MEKKVKVRFLENVEVGDKTYQKDQVVEMEESLAKMVTHQFIGFLKQGGQYPAAMAQKHIHQKAVIVA